MIPISPIARHLLIVADVLRQKVFAKWGSILGPRDRLDHRGHFWQPVVGSV